MYSCCGTNPFGELVETTFRSKSKINNLGISPSYEDGRHVKCLSNWLGRNLDENIMKHLMIVIMKHLLDVWNLDETSWNIMNHHEHDTCYCRWARSIKCCRYSAQKKCIKMHKNSWPAHSEPCFEESRMGKQVVFYFYKQVVMLKTLVTLVTVIKTVSNWT